MLTVQSMSVSKAGLTSQQNEDAFAHSPAGTWPFRAIVCDGATDGVFSRDWAQMLADAFLRTGRLEDAIAEARPTWHAEVRPRSEHLPWYVQARLADGAFAAMLGLELSADGTLKAEALGDVCLLWREEGNRLAGWPLSTPEAFAARPHLAGTTGPIPPIATASFTLQAGTPLFVASDAVAAFALAHPAAFLDALPRAWTHPAETVSVWRGLGLRNDDSTLLALTLQP